MGPDIAALDVDAKLISEVPHEALPAVSPFPRMASAMASTLAGLSMLAAALLSGAPDMVHYIAVALLLLGVFEYAYKSRWPTDRA